MRLFRHTKISEIKMTLSELPWTPEDLTQSLSVITSLLREAFGSGVSRIGLYGSWQRGDAKEASDVDIVVFLDREVSWFDAKNGMVSRSSARKDRRYWHMIEKKVNARSLDSRVYSIAVVTPGMLDYYASRGPIHLQNWAHAVMNCYPLWET
jgi:predicted nucleotidyltransferase